MRSEPVDTALRVEKAFPGAVQALQVYLQHYNRGPIGWEWLRYSQFVCFVNEQSLLKIPWLIVWVDPMVCRGSFVWDAGGWRHSLSDERALAGMEDG